MSAGPTNQFGKSDPMCEYLRRRRKENQPEAIRDIGYSVLEERIGTITSSRKVLLGASSLSMPSVRRPPCPLSSIKLNPQPATRYCNLAYSDLASLRMGIS